jgi:photosystem II stability/assembly factor-like uncharacterized protein
MRPCLLGPALRWFLLGILALGLAACGSTVAEDQECESLAPVDTWYSLDGPTAHVVTTLAQDPHDPRTLYAGLLNGGVLISTDDGEHWQHFTGERAPRSAAYRRGEPDYALDIQAIAPSRDGDLYVGTLGDGVHAYLPGGAWERVGFGLRDPNARELVLGGSAEEFLYVGTAKGARKLSRLSPDSTQWQPIGTSGTWWEQLSIKEESARSVQALFASDEPVPRLYVGTSAGFYFSLDNGETWQQPEAGVGREHAIIDLAVDPQDLDRLVASIYEPELIYVSPDGGRTWQGGQQEFSDVVEDIIFSTATPGLIYAVTYDRGLYTSQDGGEQWQRVDEIGHPLRVLLETAGGRLLAGTDGHGIWYRDQGGEWTEAFVPRVRLTVQVLLPHGTDLYAGTECCGVFRRSEDCDWEPWSQGLPFQARVVSALAADDLTGELYAGTHGDGVYRRAPDAERWQALGRGLQDAALQVLALQFVPSGSAGTLLACTNTGLYRLQDGDWNNVGPPCDQILWVPGSQDLFARTLGNKVAESRSGGSNWDVDPEAPDEMAQLALATCRGLQCLVPDNPDWTLFGLTFGNSLYDRTEKRGWEQSEFESIGNEAVSIWSYPDASRGYLLLRVERNEDMLPPTSQASLELQRSSWRASIEPQKTGIQRVATDPEDSQILYAATANDGVYSARVAPPGFWQQFPDDYPLKQGQVQVIIGILAILLIVAIVSLVFWLRKPLPPPVELEVRLGARMAEDLCQVEVEASDGSAATAEVRVPAVLLKRDVRHLLFANLPDAHVQTVGEHLFAFAFGSPDLQAVYDEAKRQAVAGLRLRIDAQGWAAELPWEVLYDPHLRNYLALTENYSITRRSSGVIAPTVWNVADELSALLVTASPRDLGRLEIEQEAAAIQNLLESSGKVKVTRVEHATPRALRDKLGGRTCQLLHFVGHAFEGALMLEDDEGDSVPFDAPELEAAIGQHNLRFVFLSACEAAGVVLESETSALAYMLAEKGVPLVLAMQHEIGDTDALQFVETFYRELVVTGSVEVALNLARVAIYSRHGVRRPVWAIPVLLLRGKESEILASPRRWKQKLLPPLRRRAQTGDKPKPVQGDRGGTSLE